MLEVVALAGFTMFAHWSHWAVPNTPDSVWRPRYLEGLLETFTYSSIVPELKSMMNNLQRGIGWRCCHVWAEIKASIG